MRYKILILGPIGDIGGRELETGFIAKTLGEDNCDVELISSLNYTDESQIFDFIKAHQIHRLNGILLKKKVLLRFLAWISYLKSGKKKAIIDYVSNKLSKALFYKTYAKKELESFIDKSDLVIICAQLSSAFVPEIVEYAHKSLKPLVIRTSSEIKSTDSQYKNWLEKVTLFIHHSETNASRLSFLNSHSYDIIDQCTFKEAEMLKISPVTKFEKILYVGRLSSEKGILELVKYFKLHGKNLHLSIVGDGSLRHDIELLVNTEDNIKLLGYKSQDEIVDCIKESDALIIPSYHESGPLVGLEAMASARLLISTKVGAMPYRLKHTRNQFWLDINDSNSLAELFFEIENLPEEDIKSIAQQNRDTYLLNYKMNTLENLYKKSIFRLLEHKARV